MNKYGKLKKVIHNLVLQFFQNQYLPPMKSPIPSMTREIICRSSAIRGEKSGPVEVDFLGKATEVTTTVLVQTSGFYAVPWMGWRWYLLEQLSAGMGVGWLIPLSASTSIDASTDDPLGQILIESLKRTDRYQQLESDAKAKAEQGTYHSLLYIAVVRVSWWF